MNNTNKKKVKVVATLGPASDKKTTIESMALAGVNVFRLNLSHRTHEESRRSIRLIKETEERAKRPIGILADLAGPKVRIGEVEEGAELKTGSKVKISANKTTGDEKYISVNYPAILKELKPGTSVFLGDGDVIMKVTEQNRNEVTAKVVIGGKIRSRMGFLAQGISLKGIRLSQKDKEDINALTKEGVTAFAVSFVQSKEDINRVKRLVPEGGPMVFAKIETASALDNIEEIVDAADGVMVARGDLGLSIPMERVPMIQKDIIRLAAERTKPVITATQMLDSMTENPLPTRAEVADVTNAILDGTDAIMFSGETAIGKYPVKVVRMARSLILSTEGRIKERNNFKESDIASVVSNAVVHTAQQSEAKIILVLTESGRTAQRISRYRNHIPILALSPHVDTARKLNFSWGVYPRLEKGAKIHNFNELTKEVQKAAKNNRVIRLKRGDVFVASAGVPFGTPGATNLAFVNTVK